MKTYQLSPRKLSRTWEKSSRSPLPMEQVLSNLRSGTAPIQGKTIQLISDGDLETILLSSDDVGLVVEKIKTKMLEDGDTDIGGVYEQLKRLSTSGNEFVRKASGQIVSEGLLDDDFGMEDIDALLASMPSIPTGVPGKIKNADRYSSLLAGMKGMGLRDITRGGKGEKKEVSGASTSDFYSVTGDLFAMTRLIKAPKKRSDLTDAKQQMELFGTALATEMGLPTVKTAIHNEGEVPELRMEDAEVYSLPKVLISDYVSDLPILFFNLGKTFVFDMVIDNYDRIAVTPDAPGNAGNLFIGSPSSFDKLPEKQKGLLVLDNEPSFESTKGHMPVKEQIAWLMDRAAIMGHLMRWLSIHVVNLEPMVKSHQPSISDGIEDGIRIIQSKAKEGFITGLFDYIMGMKPSELLTRYRERLEELEKIFGGM